SSTSKAALENFDTHSRTKRQRLTSKVHIEQIANLTSLSQNSDTRPFGWALEGRIIQRSGIKTGNNGDYFSFVIRDNSGCVKMWVFKHYIAAFDAIVKQNDCVRIFCPRVRSIQSQFKLANEGSVLFDLAADPQTTITAITEIKTITKVARIEA